MTAINLQKRYHLYTPTNAAALITVALVIMCYHILDELLGIVGRWHLSCVTHFINCFPVCAHTQQ